MKKQSGFTIIEVVLVLAIAGLIFLIVFLALPQLQASRRDTARKSDLGKIAGALSTSASANMGAYPATTSELNAFAGAYASSFKDPSSGNAYTIQFGTGASTNKGWIFYKTAAKCDSTGTVADSNASTNNIALSIRLEKGIHCITL